MKKNLKKAMADWASQQQWRWAQSPAKTGSFRSR